MEKILHRPLKKISLAEQAYEKIKTDILSRRWDKKLPGTRTLALELNVARATVLAATKRLKQEGFLVIAGERKAMQTAPVRKLKFTRSLNASILLLSKLEQESLDNQMAVFSLMQALKVEGHWVQIIELPTAHNNYDDIGRRLKKIEADVLIPFNFPRVLLENMLTRRTPVLALGGGNRNLNLSGIGFDYGAVHAEVSQMLFNAGHTRIVTILPEWIRAIPNGQTMSAIRNAFADAGMPLGNYNIPQWEETGPGLEKLLTELFKVTPPTAIVTRSTLTVLGVISFLRERRLSIPEDISLVALEADETLHWAYPKCRICWAETNRKLWLRHCVRRVHAMSRNDFSIKKITLQPTLHFGGSLGPAKIFPA